MTHRYNDIELELSNIHTPYIVENISHTDEIDNYDYITKIIMIGDAGVGKSSILKMFTEYTFEDSPVSTMGIDFQIAYMKVKSSEDVHRFNKRIQQKTPIFKLQIWDCAGQERFHAIVKSYIRGANIVIYTFDVTDAQSFEQLYRWKQTVEDEIGTPQESKYMAVLVGNKMDKADYRAVSLYQAKKFASEIDTFYAEVSAKNNNDIKRLFEEITKIMYMKMLDQSLQLDNMVLMYKSTVRVATTTTNTPLERDTDKCIPDKCIIL